MPETAWAAAGLVLAAAIALAGTQLLRRQNSRLTDAQAAHEEAQADKANAETLEIVDGGAGPYLVISTARWAMDAKDIDALAAKARGLLRAAEKAHAAEESKRRASGA